MLKGARLIDTIAFSTRRTVASLQTILYRNICGFWFLVGSHTQCHMCNLNIDLSHSNIQQLEDHQEPNKQSYDAQPEQLKNVICIGTLKFRNEIYHEPFLPYLSFWILKMYFVFSDIEYLPKISPKL